MVKETFRIPLTIMMLENEFGICGFPGEFYVEFQMDLRKQFTDFPLLFAGFANDDVGYFPTITAAAEGGYGASSVMTAVEAGAGEQMVDRAVIELYYMMGRLKHISSAP